MRRVLPFLGGKACPFHRLPASVGFVAALGATFHFTQLARRTPARKYQVQTLPTVGRESLRTRLLERPTLASHSGTLSQCPRFHGPGGTTRPEVGNLF